MSASRADNREHTTLIEHILLPCKWKWKCWYVGCNGQESITPFVEISSLGQEFRWRYHRMPILCTCVQEHSETPWYRARLSTPVDTSTRRIQPSKWPFLVFNCKIMLISCELCQILYVDLFFLLCVWPYGPLTARVIKGQSRQYVKFDDVPTRLSEAMTNLKNSLQSGL